MYDVTAQDDLSGKLVFLPMLVTHARQGVSRVDPRTPGVSIACFPQSVVRQLVVSVVSAMRPPHLRWKRSLCALSVLCAVSQQSSALTVSNYVKSVSLRF